VDLGPDERAGIRRRDPRRIRIVAAALRIPAEARPVGVRGRRGAGAEDAAGCATAAAGCGSDPGEDYEKS
jgi:hypothetical protein